MNNAHKESKRFALKEVRNIAEYLGVRLSAINRDYPNSGNEAENLLKQCRVDAANLEKKINDAIIYSRFNDESKERMYEFSSLNLE